MSTEHTSPSDNADRILRDNADRILSAIENKGYKARTIQGIVKETGISLRAVKNTLNNDRILNAKIMVVPGVRKNNRPLYVTVDRYKKETPLSVRILNLIKQSDTIDA